MKDSSMVEPRGSTTVTANLSLNEKRLLKSLEAKIDKYQQGFMEVGQALLTIKNKRLYRDDYSSFEDYCAAKWDISKQHAIRLMSAVETCRVVEPIGFPPRSERSLRPLSDLEEDQQKAVWKAVVKKAGTPEKITGAMVAEIRQRMFKNGHSHTKDTKRHSKLVHVDRYKAKLCRAIMGSPKLRKVASKAILCEIVAFIRRYE